MRLPFQIFNHALMQIVRQQRTLGYQGIDPFFLNQPADTIDEERVLESVVLRQHRIQSEVLSVEHLHEVVDDGVKLRDLQLINVLYQQEHLYFVEFDRVSEAVDDYVQDF